ncbi:MAG TPA: ArsA-related P-loop ATPase [Myxococcaceae bacterium]|nr:ArsA-related P-loop ATPase [Myxococcaceae bacterium]
MNGSPLVDALRHKSVLVCVGAGGVGKTTLSASLALRAASGEARTALVCTIDPARRLANSLGLSQLGNEETRISEEIFEQSNVPTRAPLHAMMLDMKRTWDELVERHAPPEARERILASRFYQSLSTRLAGSQEYIAMEKLSQLRARSEYELIVLDTPPTAHALDFLEAPNRVLDFLDNDAARWLLSPARSAGKLGFKMLSKGGSYALKTLSRFTGTEMLEEMSTFLMSISSLNESFRERAREVRALLAAESTSFVIVTIPSSERLDEVIHFQTLLQQNEMNVAAIVVNRVHPSPTPQQMADARRVPLPLRSRVEETLEEMRAVAIHDAMAIAELQRECDPTPLVLVPRFERDVHDLGTLWETSRYLVGDVRVPAGGPVEEAATSRAP